MNMKFTFTFLTLLGFMSTAFAQEDPIAIINARATGCADKPILFNNGSVNANEYLWRFGDGTTSTERAPRHTFTITGKQDSFWVTLIATDTVTDVSDSMIRKIKIQRSAKAKFKYRLVGIAGIFHNQSTDYDGLVWEFGDGKTSFSIADSIIHIYPQGDSTYNARLIANTAFGCNDTVEQELNVVDSAKNDNSILENNMYRMRMFPNPSNDQVLQFELSAPERLSISISDVQGKTVHVLNNSYQEGIQQIHIGSYLTDQPSGLYFVTLNNERETYVLKAYKP